MVSSQKENLLRVLELKRKQKAEHFQTLRAPVDIVTQEEVVVASNVSGFDGRFPDVEEAHEIVVVAVNVTKDFDRWLEVCFEQDWLCAENLLDLCNKVEDLLLFDREGFKQSLGLLSFLWLE